MTTTINPPHANPFEIFTDWLACAEKTESNDPTAMALATVSSDGKPSNRMVLMKSFDADGFVFFTNSRSRKGQNLAQNPHVALLFHWKTLRRQVRIEGAVTPVSEAESDAYFATRAVISRLGAAASEQSQPLDDKQILIDRVNDLRQTYDENSIPRPDHWHGYRVKPELIEFWMDGEYRLHDRFNYTADGAGGWDIQRLYP